MDFQLPPTENIVTTSNIDGRSYPSSYYVLADRIMKSFHTVLSTLYAHFCADFFALSANSLLNFSLSTVTS